MGKIALHRRPDTRDHVEIARFPVALVKPGEDTDDFRIPLRAEPGVVGLQVLAGGGHGQHHGGLARRAAEQRQLRLDAGDGPARAVPVPGQAAQRPGFGQGRARAFVQPGAMAQVGDTSVSAGDANRSSSGSWRLSMFR